MNRIIAFILLLAISISLFSACAAESTPPTTVSETTPSDLEFGQGIHFGGEFTRTYNCLKREGGYLNFYVKNNGSGPVVITINGKYSRTIPAGTGGHICAPVTATLFPQSMTVKCVTASGDNISIEWKVAQRNVDTT